MDSNEPSEARRPEKSAAAFRTISEVATDLDLPQHVLRFWEGKFPQVKPLKRGGGRRYYRPEDVALLRRIKELLHNEGYTIKGVQKLLREPGGQAAAPEFTLEGGTAAPRPKRPNMDPKRRAELESILGELKEIRDLLKSDFQAR